MRTQACAARPDDRFTTITGTKTNSTVASQINYTLDANGNLTSDGLREFQYDGSDRLSKVILGSTFVGTDTIAGNELAAHTYLHNAAGQRVFKSEPKTEATAPNEATLGTGFVDWLRTNFRWLWATAQTNATLGNSYLYAEPGAGSGQTGLPSWALLGEYGNGGTSSTGRTEYIWLPTANGQAIPVGMLRAGKLTAIHTDHLGTPRLIVDNTNTPVWQWAYSAFGDNAPTGILKPTTNAGSAFISTPAGSNGNLIVTLLATSNPVQVNNLRFPGQFADSETGFFYNYFRSYQPNQGRYTQNDPIGLAGGWNRMGYVGGNPVIFIDPKGLAGIAANVNARGYFTTMGISGGAGVVVDPVNANACIQVQICSELGLGMAFNTNLNLGLNTGRVTSGTTQSSGVFGTGGFGLPGQGSIRASESGSGGSVSSGTVGIGGGFGVAGGVQTCRTTLLCLRNNICDPTGGETNLSNILAP